MVCRAFGWTLDDVGRLRWGEWRATVDLLNERNDDGS